VKGNTLGYVEKARGEFLNTVVRRQDENMRWDAACIIKKYSPKIPAPNPQAVKPIRHIPQLVRMQCFPLPLSTALSS